MEQFQNLDKILSIRKGARHFDLMMKMAVGFSSEREKRVNTFDFKIL